MGDPALLFSQPRPDWTPRKHIIINIGCHDEMWGTPESIYANVLQAARLLIEQGYELMFLPMHHIDVSYARRLQKEPGMEKLTIEENYLDKDKVIAAFKSTDLVLGQRLHSVVLAHACGVPAIPLAYRPKCYDYLASINQEHMALRTDQLDPGVMVEKVQQLVANYDQNVAQLNGAVEQIRTSLRTNAQKVNAMIDQQCAS